MPRVIFLLFLAFIANPSLNAAEEPHAVFVIGADGLRLWIKGSEFGYPKAPGYAARGRMFLTFAIAREIPGDLGLRALVVAADKLVRFKPEGGI